ncbi:hypothetical protein MMC16_003265 [Acarospora aff. strigata]|nr:hypothetical protein [Acarospora aff. strigata]
MAERSLAMKFLDLYVVTFNCARELIKPEVFASHLFDARPSIQSNTSPPPDILVLSLQEVAPIAYSFLGGSYLIPYFDRFRHAIELAAISVGDGNTRYRGVVTRNVGMTALMIFVKQNHVEAIEGIETAGVGVGLLEMGNKGAVGVRLRYTTGASDELAVGLTFVAAHLAPMESALRKRNEDWMNVVRRLVFTPTGHVAARQATRSLGEESEEAPLLPGSTDNWKSPASGLYSATSHLILAGDLNYRTSQIKPGPDTHQSYPQPAKDTGDSKHYAHLLKQDQLTQELRAGRTCHGLKEAPISFPPTYKYSDGQRARAETDNLVEWDWAKHRWPSWCDRVLYLDLPTWMQDMSSSVAFNVHGYTALPLLSTSDHRPVALSCSLPLLAIPEPNRESVGDDPRLSPPFPIDPTWRQRRASARRKELIVGILSYLTLTWEGNGVLVATLIGVLGGWMVIRSLLAP